MDRTTGVTPSQGAMPSFPLSSASRSTIPDVAGRALRQPELFSGRRLERIRVISEKVEKLKSGEANSSVDTGVTVPKQTQLAQAPRGVFSARRHSGAKPRVPTQDHSKQPEVQEPLSQRSEEGVLGSISLSTVRPTTFPATSPEIEREEKDVNGVLDNLPLNQTVPADVAFAGSVDAGTRLDETVPGDFNSTEVSRSLGNVPPPIVVVVQRGSESDKNSENTETASSRPANREEPPSEKVEKKVDELPLFSPTDDGEPVEARRRLSRTTKVGIGAVATIVALIAGAGVATFGLSQIKAVANKLSFLRAMSIR